MMLVWSPMYPFVSLRIPMSVLALLVRPGEAWPRRQNKRSNIIPFSPLHKMCWSKLGIRPKCLLWTLGFAFCQWSMDRKQSKKRSTAVKLLNSQTRSMHLWPQFAGNQRRLWLLDRQNVFQTQWWWGVPCDGCQSFEIAASPISGNPSWFGLCSAPRCHDLFLPLWLLSCKKLLRAKRRKHDFVHELPPSRQRMSAEPQNQKGGKNQTNHHPEPATRSTDETTLQAAEPPKVQMNRSHPRWWVKWAKKTNGRRNAKRTKQQAKPQAKPSSRRMSNIPQQALHVNKPALNSNNARSLIRDDPTRTRTLIWTAPK